MNRNHNRTLITEQLLDAGNSGELPCNYDGGFLTDWGRVVEPFGTMTADGLAKLLDSIDRAHERDIPISREEAWEAYDEYEEWDDGDRRPDPNHPDYPSYTGCVCPHGECDYGPMCDLRRTVHQAIWEQAIQLSGLSLGRSKWWYRKMVTDGELRLGDPAHPPMATESWQYLHLGFFSGEYSDEYGDWYTEWWNQATFGKRRRQGYRRQSIRETWQDHEEELRKAKIPPPVDDDWGTGLYATRTI